MEKMAETVLEQLLGRFPSLCPVRQEIWEAFEKMASCYCEGGKLLLAGNGGSASDAQHIAAELMKGFLLSRPLPEPEQERLRGLDPDRGALLGERLQRALPALALCGHDALGTAFSNDVDPRLCFAQQVYGYGRPGDVFLGISTSGNSENILFAALAARAIGMTVIGFTGADGGRLAGLADLCVRMPERECYRVQELQLPVYHCWCQMLEILFFGKEEGKDGSGRKRLSEDQSDECRLQQSGA